MTPREVRWWAAVAALSAAGCASDVVLPIAVDRAPTSAIVLELGGARPRYRAFEPAPRAIEVASDADVHVLLYDDPLSLLGVDVVDGALVPFNGTLVAGASPALAPAVSLPTPDRWFSGAHGDSAVEDADVGGLEARLGFLKFERPACPEYEVESTVTLPDADDVWDYAVLGRRQVLVGLRRRLFAVSATAAIEVSLPETARAATVVGLTELGEDEVLVRTEVDQGEGGIWARLSADHRMTMAVAPPNIDRSYSVVSAPVGDRWRLLAFDGTHLAEVDPTRGSTEALAAFSDSTCLARAWLTPDGHAVVSRPREVLSVPLDEPHVVTVLADIPTDRCLRSFRREATREAFVLPIGSPNDGSEVYWRAPGAPTWRVVRVAEALALSASIDGELVAVTLQGPGLLRLGRHPQLCPIAPNVPASIVRVGDRMAALPQPRTPLAGQVLWLRRR